MLYSKLVAMHRDMAKKAKLPFAAIIALFMVMNIAQIAQTYSTQVAEHALNVSFIAGLLVVCASAVAMRYRTQLAKLERALEKHPFR